MNRTRKIIASQPDMVRAIAAAHPRVLRIFDEEAKRGVASPSTRVASELAVRIERLAEAISAVAAAGLHEESFGLMRVPAELLIHQFFILYAGPGSGVGSKDDLAIRFLEFADHRRVKLYNLDPRQAAEASIHVGRHQTEADVADAIKEVEQRVALSGHNFGNSWHTMNTRDMGERVKLHLPSFVQEHGLEDVFNILYPIINMGHTRLHADSLAHAVFYINDCGVLKLRDVRLVDYNWAEAAGLVAFIAYLAAAEQYGVQDAVFEMLDHHARRSTKLVTASHS